MVKPFTLQTVLELMQMRADDATRQLARLIASERDARSRLGLLTQYRDDYGARFQEAARGGLPQREWRNYQEFINRLDEAIEIQRKSVLQQALDTAAGQASWQQQRGKLKAFDTLSTRHYASESARQLKWEQKIQDEFAARDREYE